MVSEGRLLRTSPPGGDPQWERAHYHPGYPTRPQYTSNVGYDEPLSQVAVSPVHLSICLDASLADYSFFQAFWGTTTVHISRQPE